MSERINPEKHELLTVDEHIRLQAVSESEAGALFAITDANREYLAEFLPWAGDTKSEDDSLAFIRTIQRERSAGAQFGFGIYYDGQLAGHISLMHVNDGEMPEIGYWIAENYSGKGITSRAAKAVEDFGFKTLGLEEIIIKARKDNAASNAIAEKLGYELFTVDHRDNEAVNVWRKVHER